MDNNFRKDFPFFSNNTNKDIVYFDNAATTQRPKCVIDAIDNFYQLNNANPLRGLYDLSVRATDEYEKARSITASFINAPKTEEIIFTRNTTESLNLIAYTWGFQNIQKDDEIVISVMEHHSNILPWQMICKIKGAKLIFLEFDKETYEIPESELLKINNRTKIVSIAHTSNVIGITNNVKHIGEIAHNNGALFIVDGAQSIPHIKINIQDINADFFAFSGHKICGPMGCGVLFGKYDILNNMNPFLRGGEMIEYVTRENATWAEIPHKFEAGTVNAAGAVGLAAALEYIKNHVTYDYIEKKDKELSKLLIEKLQIIPHVHIYGSKNTSLHNGIVSFTIDGVHPHDIASILDTEKIAIRAGHHCAQPLGQFLNVTSTARASLYFYNTEEEVERFIKSVSKLREWSGFKD
ncbi:MAG: SufS family cysteine desulfurase [Treponema sp.]|jgi:cysteine desulfurase / selenocysteine lyase|nr:SufS family cysteine desulfurase [Treponema sp.]